MLLVDLKQKRIVSDEELKDELVNANPYQDWIKTSKVSLSSFKLKTNNKMPDDASLLDLQQAHGYNKEDLKFFLNQ